MITPKEEKDKNSLDKTEKRIERKINRSMDDIKNDRIIKITPIKEKTHEKER